MNDKPIIYVTNMGTTFEAIDKSLDDFINKKRNLPAPKYLVVFYGGKDKKPKENAEKVRTKFGSEFNHVDLFEIQDPENIDVCIHTMKKKIESMIDEHNLENFVLYVNCTAGTKAMTFALAYTTLWLVPGSGGFRLVYQGGVRDSNGRVLSSEHATVFESELKNLAILSLSLNEFLKKRFNVSAHYLSLLSTDDLTSIEKIAYHGILTVYFFSIFNFEKAKSHCENYLKAFDPSYRHSTGALQKPITEVVHTLQVLEKPIETGFELKRHFDFLRKEELSKALTLIKREIAKKWQDCVDFLFSLVALAINKMKNGEFTESVMLSYRIAELAVQMSLLNYGISVWHFSQSISILKPDEFKQAILKELDPSDQGKLEKQIGFKRALQAFLSLKKLQAHGHSDSSVDLESCLKIAESLQSNRNYCFLAHGFDYKDKKTAENAIDDLKRFLAAIKIVSSKEDLDSRINKYSILFR